MDVTHILIYSEDAALFSELVALLPGGYHATYLHTLPGLQEALTSPDCALLIFDVRAAEALSTLETLHPYTAQAAFLVIAPEQISPALVNACLDLRPYAFISHPLEKTSAARLIAEALAYGLQHTQREHLKHDLSEANRRLNQRLQELNTIYTVGKSVASTLEVDGVLERIVTASVNLTQAEEGFILLREGEKLYLRIAKNMNEALAKRLYVEAEDPIAWQVIRSGRPTMLRRNTKIATGYLVRALLYVPLTAPGRGVVGVLGVVNLTREYGFSENHLFALSAIADFAAIALENAHLFSAATTERSRIQAILEHAAEAIIVTDTENQLLLWSNTAGQVFNIHESAQGEPLARYVAHTALHDIFYQTSPDTPRLHTEVELDNDRTYNAQLTSVPKVGRVVIMQDITHLKELDRLKSEFVSTVSHDLRTPLTTVQGYIELLNRVGPISDMQQSFIQKALSSLSHITSMISDLLDIGRIEAGYDLEMHPCCINDIAREATETYQIYAEEQEIALTGDISEVPLWVQGNARRLRQVLENLMGNAIKYNRPGGWVKVRVCRDDHHVIVRVEDNGIGVPVEEQPKIFQRFYRVYNPETEDVPGTGLGLAIVKSVAEKHKGRVWVESTPGEGSIFAVVLPLYEPETEGEAAASQAPSV